MLSLLLSYNVLADESTNTAFGPKPAGEEQTVKSPDVDEKKINC